jgi:hypothetical protein
MNEAIEDLGHRQPANLTALQRELADLATTSRNEFRPPKGRPAEIQGPVIVIRGK